ncbi:MAG TPA: hypothetical protein DDW55_00450 [Gammaproteobacteria bacterium]|nr:hypothetical protein [Gammaproteobacteria bacterium]
MLALAAPAMAQNVQNIDKQDMQLIMQQVQEMQTCMANIDQTELKALETRSKKFESEVTVLCDAGKRDAAQDIAMAFGKEVTAAPAMKTMKKCSEKLVGMMPNMSIPDIESQLKNKNICDMVM